MSRKKHILIIGIFIEVLIGIFIYKILSQSHRLFEKQKITFKQNLSYIHGFLLVKDSLFGLTNTSPAKLVKISTKNLSKYQIISFPNDGRHDNGTELTYINNKLYLVFGGHGSYVSELQPDNLIYKDLWSSDKDYSDPVINLPSMTSDGKYLYVISSTKPTYIHKINLKNFYDITTISLKEALNYGHSIRFDKGFLYATGEQDNGWISKINPSDLKYHESIFNNDVSTPTDDFAVTNKYIFTCFENKSGIIYRTDKENLFVNKINTGIFAPCFGLYFDGNNIWAVYDTSPGQLVGINPDTLKVSRYDLTESHPSEILSLKDSLFITFWESPAKIMRVKVQ